MQDVETLIAALRAGTTAEREQVKARLVEMCRGEGGGRVRDQLDTARKGELLEVQWEIGRAHV